MNKILNRIFFGGTTTNKTRKPKRTKEQILGIRKDGYVIAFEYVLPKDRSTAVQQIFDSYPNVTLINVHLLSGKTKIIRRPSTINPEKPICFDCKGEISKSGECFCNKD